MATESDNPINHFACTNFRNDRRVFGIKQADRRSHMYIIGKTGTGKSTLLETMMRHDIAAGAGFALLDPHGDLVEKVLVNTPQNRKDNVIYFNAPDMAHPLGFNPLESVPPTKRPLAASGLLEVFKKIWTDTWGPRLEHIMRNAFLALLDQHEATLADVLRLMSDVSYRKQVCLNIINAQVRQFWQREFENYPIRFRAEAIAPIQNKVGAFLSNPIMRNIVTQTKSSFNLRDVMDQGKVLLVNLAKGKIGEDNTALLGSMLVSKISLSGLSRASIQESNRRDFYLYLDEFQSFTTLSLSTMLSELRKYRIGLVLSHQYLSQIDLQIRDAILGNSGTIISFRLGSEDARILEREFYPEFRAADLINLPNYSIYLKLMIDGVVSRPFSAETLAA